MISPPSFFNWILFKNSDFLWVLDKDGQHP